MSKYLANKKIWLDRINQLAYEGRFEEAHKLIDDGLKKNFKLTNTDASEILESVSVDVRYWFVKLLIDLGGEFPDFVIEFAKGVLEDKKSGAYLTWSKIPDAIEGFEFVIKTAGQKKKKLSDKSKHQIGQNSKNSNVYKYLKYKHKYKQLKKKLKSRSSNNSIYDLLL